MPTFWSENGQTGLYFYEVKKRDIFFLIYFKKCFLMFLFSFIIGMPAFWSENKRTGFYFCKIKGRDIFFFNLL
jgi:hypothetical protein